LFSLTTINFNISRLETELSLNLKVFQTWLNLISTLRKSKLLGSWQHIKFHNVETATDYVDSNLYKCNVHTFIVVTECNLPFVASGKPKPHTRKLHCGSRQQ